MTLVGVAEEVDVVLAGAAPAVHVVVRRRGCACTRTGGPLSDIPSDGIQKWFVPRVGRRALATGAFDLGRLGLDGALAFARGRVPRGAAIRRAWQRSAPAASAALGDRARRDAGRRPSREAPRASAPRCERWRGGSGATAERRHGVVGRPGRPAAAPASSRS